MIIDMLFNGINLLILLGLAFYMFRVYASPAFLKALLQEEEKKNLRKQAYENIIIAGQELKNKAAEEQKFLVYLQKRVALWQEKKTLLMHTKEVEQRAVRQKMYDNMQQKTRDRMLFVLQKKAFESAYQDAEKQLVDCFENQKEQELYIDAILAKLIPHDR